MKKLRGLDGRAIKQFFIWNVEKIVFGVSMFLVALFVYGAMNQEPYAKKPEDLQKSIKAAKENIVRQGDIPEVDKPQEPRFVEFAERARELVPATEYGWKKTISQNNKLITGTKRGDVEVLAATDIEATTGVGPFALRNPDARFVQAGGGIGPGGVPGMNPPGTRPGEPPQNGKGEPKKPKNTPRGPGRLGTGLPGEGAAPTAPVGRGGEGEGGIGGPMGAGVGIAAGPRGVAAPVESNVEGVRWACITGLVPYKAQREKYRDEFEAAAYLDPLKDEPSWLGFLVERAEVTEADIRDPKKSQWKPISLKQALEFSKTWAVRGGDVVDPAYTRETLTFPVGPLLERNWGREVAHSKIPLLDLSQRNAGGTAVEESQAITGASGPTEGDDITAILERNRKSKTDPSGGRAPPQGRMPSTGPRGFSGGEGGVGGYGGRQPGYGGRQPGYGGEGGIPSGGGDPNLEDQEHLMFRFFDFTVEEGKRYRYRVQLVLENPNYNVRAHFLKDASLAKEQIKKTDWSEPSPVVSVSSYNFLLAGPVTAAAKAVEEPKARLVAVQLDPKLGTKAVYEMRPQLPGKGQAREMLPVNRGQLIQFTAKVHVVHPLTRIPKEETVEFNSNMTVLDMRGGERFNATSFTDRDLFPGEVLLMDANGWLVSRSETADETDYQAEVEWLRLLDEAKQSGTGVAPGGVPPAGGFPGRGPGREGS